MRTPISQRTAKNNAKAYNAYFEANQQIQYNRQQTATVLEEDETHILIQLDSGSKIATKKSSFIPAQSGSL